MLLKFIDTDLTFGLITNVNGEFEWTGTAISLGDIERGVVEGVLFIGEDDLLCVATAIPGVVGLAARLLSMRGVCGADRCINCKLDSRPWLVRLNKLGSTDSCRMFWYDRVWFSSGGWLTWRIAPRVVLRRWGFGVWRWDILKLLKLARRFELRLPAGEREASKTPREDDDCWDFVLLRPLLPSVTNI